MAQNLPRISLRGPHNKNKPHHKHVQINQKLHNVLILGMLLIFSVLCTCCFQCINAQEGSFASPGTSFAFRQRHPSAYYPPNHNHHGAAWAPDADSIAGYAAAAAANSRGSANSEEFSRFRNANSPQGSGPSTNTASARRVGHRGGPPVGTMNEMAMASANRYGGHPRFAQ